MNRYNLEHSVHLICIKASSFPDGVAAAHEQLHKVVPFSKDRRNFSVSCPNKTGEIIYKAGAEELYEGEAVALGYETAKVEPGIYDFIDIENYMSDVSKIGLAFNELLKSPEIDPEGQCVEFYLNEHDVRCMVKLKYRFR